MPRPKRDVPPVNYDDDAPPRPPPIGKRKRNSDEDDDDEGICAAPMVQMQLLDERYKPPEEEEDDDDEDSDLSQPPVVKKKMAEAVEDVKRKLVHNQSGDLHKTMCKLANLAIDEWFNRVDRLTEERARREMGDLKILCRHSDLGTWKDAQEQDVESGTERSQEDFDSEFWEWREDAWYVRLDCLLYPKDGTIKFQEEGEEIKSTFVIFDSYGYESQVWLDIKSGIGYAEKYFHDFGNDFFKTPPDNVPIVIPYADAIEDFNTRHEIEENTVTKVQLDYLNMML